MPGISDVVLQPEPSELQSELAGTHRLKAFRYAAGAPKASRSAKRQPAILRGWNASASEQTATRFANWAGLCLQQICATRAHGSQVRLAGCHNLCLELGSRTQRYSPIILVHAEIYDYMRLRMQVERLRNGTAACARLHTPKVVPHLLPAWDIGIGPPQERSQGGSRVAHGHAQGSEARQPSMRVYTRKEAKSSYP